MQTTFTAAMASATLLLAFVTPAAGIRDATVAPKHENESGRSFLVRLSRFFRKNGEPPPETAISVPRRALTRQEHWSRVASVIERASVTASTIESLQAAARMQLELAEYAMDRIFEDAAPAMRLVPAPVRTRRQVC